MTKIQNNRDKHKQAWISYLESIPFTFYGTGTTRYSLTLASNRRLLERFYKALCIKGSKLFYVAEPFDLKDGYHSHWLFYIPNNIEPFNPDGDFLFKTIINTWQWATGNKDLKKEDWNRIDLQRYDSKRGAGGYCGKYLFKQNSDYDMLTDYKASRSDYDTNFVVLPVAKPYKARIPLSWLCRSATRT